MSPRISALTTEAPTSATDLIGNVGSTTRRFSAAQTAAAGLGSPTSGAVLTYSSGSSVPEWSIPTSGAVLVASSVGVPTWRALGTSGQILQSTGGTPTWVATTAVTEGWTAPTFLSSWVNFEGGFSSAGFYKDPWDRIHLRGMVKGESTVAGTIFTLPVGYRPAATLIFPTISNDVFGRIDINSAGGVVMVTGSSIWLVLNGISFRASQ